VEMVSLGVDPEDAPVLLAVPLRVEISMASGFAAAFNTFALGRVPKGAMFATTPCLSIPASANEGLAGASCGSILWRVRSAGGAIGEEEDLPLVHERLWLLSSLGHGPGGIWGRITGRDGKWARISGS
jgi:hypothetical protein